MTASVSQDTAYLPSHLLSWDLGEGRTLRLAEPSEYDEVGAVLQAAFTTGCWVTPTYLAHLAEVRLRALTSHIWVVLDAEGILGVVLTPKPQHHSPEQFTFNVLGVTARARGLGVGWHLVDHSVAIARALGYATVEIRSSPQMTAAHALYYRYGFVRRPEHETLVVDSGQRLFAFTYRVTDPDPVAKVDYQPPKQAWSFAAAEQEITVDITQFQPPSSTGTVAAVPEGAWTEAALRVHPASLRGRAAIATLRFEAKDERIEWDAFTSRDPVLRTQDREVTPQWTQLSRGFAGVDGALYPRADAAAIDAIVTHIHDDLVVGIERALFAEDPEERLATLRLYYARLGWFDALLRRRRYLVGERISVADLELLAVLVGLDFQHRAHLPNGSAAVADYPALFDYARRLLNDGLLPPAVLSAVGIVPGLQPPTWGVPAAVEGIDDLSQAWLVPETEPEAVA